MLKVNNITSTIYLIFLVHIVRLLCLVCSMVKSWAFDLSMMIPGSSSMNSPSSTITTSSSLLGFVLRQYIKSSTDCGFKLHYVFIGPTILCTWSIWDKNLLDMTFASESLITLVWADKHKRERKNCDMNDKKHSCLKIKAILISLLTYNLQMRQITIVLGCL